MREELKKIAGLRSRFRGTFSRFGSAVVRFRINGRRCSKEVVTLVLVDVTDSRGNLLTDHLWFKMGKQFEELELKPGDRVEFTARVDKYTKRRRDEYDGESYLVDDYCLKRPTKMVKLGVHDEKGTGLLFRDLRPDTSQNVLG
ncbi:MAG TPA: hypothetical protein VF543_22535 [Pyrinomonadaceae bacterium]|jgi:hypothetical protein